MVTHNKLYDKVPFCTLKMHRRSAVEQRQALVEMNGDYNIEQQIYYGLLALRDTIKNVKKDVSIHLEYGFHSYNHFNIIIHK